MSHEEVKICPKCGRPMRREEDRRVCDFCGFTMPIYEYVSYQTVSQDEEYVQPTRRSRTQRIYQMGTGAHKAARKAKEHASQILSRLGLHDEQARAIVDEAMKIFEMAASRDIVKGRSVLVLIEGAIYAMIRKHNLPINLDRLATAIAEIRMTKKKPGEKDTSKELRELKKQVKSEILKAYNLLRTNIGGEYFVAQAEAPPYIDRYCEDLNVSDDIRRLAREIFKIAKERRLTVGRNPSGIAAAAIYVAAKLLKRRDIQQRKVARQAGITEVTLRNRSRELEKILCERAEEYEKRLSEALGFPIDLREYCANVLKRKKKRCF